VPGDSELLESNLPCPDCGSSRGLARYDDGHTFCFKCEKNTPGDGTSVGTAGLSMGGQQVVTGEPKALKARGISEETCRKWGYQVGEDRKGQTVQIANFRNREGQLVGQKLRTKDKKFSVIKAKGDELPLFGTHLWRDGGRKIVVTEGEIDALSVSQAQGNKWPVVSLPNGASSAKKALANQIEWLESFDEVILMFDEDDPGKEAIEKCASLFTPGKLKVASLPEGYKDPNELLLDGKESAIIDAVFGAKAYRPDGVITAADVAAEAVKPAEWGLSWPFEEITKATYGIRRKECYAIGAGTGVGKTDFTLEVVAHLVQEHDLPVGLIFLEQPPVETVKRIAGKLASKPFHIPDGGYTQEELTEWVGKVVDSGKLYMYDHFGSADWLTVKSRIRYMVQALGIKDIFLDHLTALAAQSEDERKELERIMSDIGSMVQEMNFTLYFISHLATPEGKPHEEGGRVMIRHFKGSRAIGFWSNFMFGLERNQQDESRRDVTTFRVLKDRHTGRSNGMTLDLKYDHNTGRLSVYEENPFETPTGDSNDEF